MKKDIEWVISEIDQRVENVEEHEKTTAYNKGVARGLGISLFLINQLDEPEVLSQEWIDGNKCSWYKLKVDGYYISVENLQNLLVPTLSEMETVEITKEQVMEWLDNNEFYCHATAETVLENAVDKGELGYYGTKYSVVKKEPETVADVITTFWKSLERLKEVMSMKVEEMEE